MRICKNIFLAAMAIGMSFSLLNAQGTGQRFEPKLKTGDAAPPIVAAKWFKGAPVTTFNPGHVYV